MTDQEARWLEIQYYMLCYKLYHLNNDMQDVITTLEQIWSLYHTFNLEIAKQIAQTLLITIRQHPKRLEVALIAHSLGVATRDIIKLTGYHSQYIYRLFRKKKNPEDVTWYYNNWTERQLETMQNVLITFNKLKEWVL